MPRGLQRCHRDSFERVLQTRVLSCAPAPDDNRRNVNDKGEVKCCANDKKNKRRDKGEASAADKERTEESGDDGVKTYDVQLQDTVYDFFYSNAFRLLLHSPPPPPSSSSCFPQPLSPALFPVSCCSHSLSPVGRRRTPLPT